VYELLELLDADASSLPGLNLGLPRFRFDSLGEIIGPVHDGTTP
jgi:hypothetical protein